MKSFLFILKLFFMLYGLGWFISFIVSSTSHDSDASLLIVSLIAVVIAFFIHWYSEDSKWEDDYLYLLFKTRYKKYSAKIRNSKEKMRNELQDE
jgi:hypothetical protein